MRLGHQPTHLPSGRTAGLVLLALIELAIRPAVGYSISYYDFHDIKNVLTFKINPATCDHPDLDSEKDTETTTLTLLQEKSILNMKGHSCQVTYSRFVDYCCAYSHSKIIATPEIEVSSPLTPLDCLDGCHQSLHHPGWDQKTSYPGS